MTITKRMRAQRGRASKARKPPVNLTLSDDLVEELKGVTGNLSGVVEPLLADVLSRERERRSGIVEQVRTPAACLPGGADREAGAPERRSAGRATRPVCHRRSIL